MKFSRNQLMPNIQVKMFLYFLGMFMVIIISLLVFYQITIDNIHDATEQAVENTIHHIAMDTDSILSGSLEQAYRISQEVSIQRTLKSNPPEDVHAYYQQLMTYNQILYERNLYLTDIDGIYVIGDNGLVYHSKSYYTIQNEDFRRTWWYRQVMETQTPLWRPPQDGSDIIENLGASTICLLVPIIDRAGGESLGVVAVEIHTETLELLQHNNLVYGGTTVMVDKDNYVIYGSDVSGGHLQNSMDTTFQKGVGTLDLEDYLFCYEYLSNGQWKVGGYVPNSQMFHQTEVLRNGILAVIILIAFGILWFLFFTTSAITKTLREVGQAMKRVEEGDFGMTIAVEKEDELGSLQRSFNHMVTHMRQLMAQEQESKRKIRIAEFQALQSQINPHFLYNTLDSINWMARMERYEKMEETITALTNFLRIGLSRGRDYITLAEELRHVENYFTIQKNRYARILDYEIQVEPSLLQHNVIKMILQPMVENAIYHGLKEKGEPGLISIVGKEIGDNLVITVADNGQGMTPERLLEIQTMMEQDIDFAQDAYGVINVQRRIRTYFGPQYGLQFESQYQVGTTVTITLPKKEDNQFCIS